MVQLFLGTLFLMLTVILVRGSLPRSRLDQLSSKTWKTAIFVFVGYICTTIFLSWCASTSDRSYYLAAFTDAVDFIAPKVRLEDRYAFYIMLIKIWLFIFIVGAIVYTIKNASWKKWTLTFSSFWAKKHAYYTQFVAMQKNFYADLTEEFYNLKTHGPKNIKTSYLNFWKNSINVIKETKEFIQLMYSKFRPNGK